MAIFNSYVCLPEGRMIIFFLAETGAVTPSRNSVGKVPAALAPLWPGLETIVSGPFTIFKKPCQSAAKKNALIVRCTIKNQWPQNWNHWSTPYTSCLLTISVAFSKSTIFTFPAPRLPTSQQCPSSSLGNLEDQSNTTSKPFFTKTWGAKPSILSGYWK